MGRLQKIRRIELLGGLRTLAQAEAQVARLGSVAVRLDALVVGVPAGGDTADRKASAVARGALDDARRSVGARHAEGLEVRAVAASAALRLKARVDVVAALAE